ncbi:MAG: hypothetical protein IJI05_00205 [Erysipelotrichaceae bacterium]|nr:hypothetical protein [Erysipelotrichaceae bacterium]
MKTLITTYAGTHQSMGAVFSVEYGRDRVIMDFGSGFNPEIPNYIKKDDNWIKDKIRLGLLPGIEGLYPRKYITGCDLKAYEDCNYNTAVFISHLHLDHMSNIGAVAEEVPVYLSEPARRLEYALEEIGQGADSNGRKYDSFSGREYVEVGSIKVYPLINSPWSHQMFGFMIETPDLKAGYTADLSLAGECPEMVQQEMEIFRDSCIDVLYCDGCNFSDDQLMEIYGTADFTKIPSSPQIPEGMLSFSEHCEKIRKLYTETSSLVVFNHYEREILDVQMIKEWAKESGRNVVLEPEAAWLAWRFFGEPVNVYMNEDTEKAGWMQQLLTENKVISRQDIINEPGRYYLHVSWQNIAELKKLPAGRYIHAEGNPFSSSEIEEMKKKVAEAGFEFCSYDDPNYRQHGYPSQVNWFVEQIRPAVVIGYHGHDPERIRNTYGYNLVPDLYQPYHLEGRMLVKEEQHHA